ncbi:MAG: hypothetical protein Q9M94_03990 [Candidatus Gracilibacteria bacterium]|nr:hypothetical protein [Candidatus Gracilibacteria bacterium]MDQ7023240.1 hypothetical protein [Candidatus Gracilibacteria bacterium]
MLTTVLEKEAITTEKVHNFYSEVDFINEKLIESEKSPVQSIESAYSEGWK